MGARDTSREASELLTRALRKVAITQYHAREFARVLDDANPYEVALQAHFEGLEGTSAEEKLAIALDVLPSTGTDKDTKRLAR